MRHKLEVLLHMSRLRTRALLQRDLDARIGGEPLAVPPPLLVHAAPPGRLVELDLAQPARAPEQRVPRRRPLCARAGVEGHAHDGVVQPCEALRERGGEGARPAGELPGFDVVDLQRVVGEREHERRGVRGVEGERVHGVREGWECTVVLFEISRCQCLVRMDIIYAALHTWIESKLKMCVCR